MLAFLRKHFGLIVVLVGAWTIAAAPVGIGNDGLVRYESLDTLLRHGKLDRSKYSLYGPIVAAPLWYLGEAIGRPDETVWMFNRGALLAAVVGLGLVLRPVLAREELVRFAALVFFGSMFPWHVMGFFAEVFHAACVGLGLALLAVRRDRWAVLGGVLCVWGTANVPASAVGLALAACVLCWHRRRFRYLALPACAAALILLENYLRRGAPLDSGYEGEAGNRTVLPYSGLPGFSYPLFFGLLVVLFSFGKGLVFFAPGLFARYPLEAPASQRPATEESDLSSVAGLCEAGALERNEPSRETDARLVYRLWLAVVVGLVLVYARWWAWYGGAVWGPRFFLFASLPAALVLARWITRAEEHSTWANALVLVAVALSCWVGANGIVFQGHGSERYWRNNFEQEHLTWFVPECSVLWLPFVVSKPLAWQDYARLATFALGFVYLAGPVVRVLVRFRHAIAATWTALCTGPRWRF
jgi:hypothetical protein